jgi:glycosyltransferase involved in cell wall biosynthesis
MRAARQSPVVLHVAQPTDGGVARYVAAVSADQAARGWRVTVTCPGTGWLAPDLAARGVPRLDWPATRTPGTATLCETLRLRQVIASVEPDVVHLHSAKAGYAGRLAVRGRLPTLFQPHAWSWLAAGGALACAALAWERAAARWTRVFVCVGRDEAELGRRSGLRGRFVVVRNGVDTERFHLLPEADRVASRELLGVRRDAPLAVCVGRITRQKGQDVLLTAWSRVRASCPDAQLVLVGPGDPRLTRSPESPPGVRCVGEATDVRPWYAAADVVVLPSRWEGLSLTLLEALASGRSVVASDVAGLAEAVPEGVGARVPAGDDAALAAAIVRRLHDRALALAEGRTAALLARREFDARDTLDRLAAVTCDLAMARHEDSATPL